MPTLDTNTPREPYTIAGESFSIPKPYAAGHALTDGEANALNQTFAENIRNNLASKVKEEKEAGTFDLSVFQERLNDYADSYEFGVRTGGGRTSDPVEAEAMSIARDLVRKAIVNKGVKLSDVKASNITELARGVLDKNPQIRETARARVEEVRAIADVELGELTSSDETEAKPKASKAKSEAAAA
jgi:hypothetical protein